MGKPTSRTIEPKTSSISSNQTTTKQIAESTATRDPATCPVCYEQFAQQDIMKIDEISHDICKSCFVEYLAVQINSNKVQPLILFKKTSHINI